MAIKKQEDSANNLHGGVDLVDSHFEIVSIIVKGCDFNHRRYSYFYLLGGKHFQSGRK